MSLERNMKNRWGCSVAGAAGGKKIGKGRSCGFAGTCRRRTEVFWKEHEV